MADEEATPPLWSAVFLEQIAGAQDTLQDEFTANFSSEVHRQPHLHLSVHLLHSTVVIICAQLIFNQLLSRMHLPQQPRPMRQRRNSQRGRRERFRHLVPLRAVTPYSNWRKSKSSLHRLILHNNQTSSNNPICNLTNYQMDGNTDGPVALVNAAILPGGLKLSSQAPG